MHTTAARDEVSLRGSTLIKNIRSGSHRNGQSKHPLRQTFLFSTPERVSRSNTRNVCISVSGYKSMYSFTGSTPGRTSQIFHPKLLSANDSFSLTISRSVTLPIQRLFHVRSIICEKSGFVNQILCYTVLKSHFYLKKICFRLYLEFPFLHLHKTLRNSKPKP